VNFGLVKDLELVKEMLHLLEHLPQSSANVIKTTVDIQVFYLPEVVNA
jgi:hypothetical protein